MTSGNRRPGVLIVVLGILSFGGISLRGSAGADRPVENSTGQSGLPWKSGAHVANELDKHVAFGEWRGRPNDIINIFTDRSSWEGIIQPGWPIDNMIGFHGQLVISQPLWPKGQGDSAACACGTYDDYWKTFGSWLVKKNRADSIIRLGWEGNGDFMYWSVTDEDLRTGNWKTCWRRVAKAIKSTNPRAVLEWTINGHGSATYGGHKPYDVYAHPNVYPGDDVVDIVGIDSYDHYPPVSNVGWEKHSVAQGAGICDTIAFARRHGKKFAVGEWGIAGRDAKNGGGDDTAFIQKMYDSFVANSDLMAYEGYYNAPLSIEPENVGSGICPALGSVDGPEASKLYRQLWSGPVVHPASNPCEQVVSRLAAQPLPEGSLLKLPEPRTRTQNSELRTQNSELRTVNREVNMGELKGRVALVTGAARGIGATIARVLAGRGMLVAVNDVNAEAASQTAERLSADGFRACAVPGSVCSAGDVQAMVSRVEEELGPLWLLVNNAGSFSHAPTAELSESAWDEPFDVDAKGVFLCSQAAIQRMIPRRRGRIVTIGSIAGLIVRTNQIAYCCAKAAAIHFTRCLAVEMAPHGITVNCICPGMTWTDMLSTSAKDRGLDLDAMTALIPAGKMAAEEDHAHLVAYLASDEASHVTGQVISVDGAQSLYHPLQLSRP